MSAWIQSRLKAAEGFLEAVDEAATHYVAGKPEQTPLPVSTNSHQKHPTDQKGDKTEVQNHAEEKSKAAEETKGVKEVAERKEATREMRLMDVCEDLRKQVADANTELEGYKHRLRESERSRKVQLEEMETMVEDVRKGDEERHRLEATLQAQIVAQEMELTKLQSECRTWKEKADEIEERRTTLEESHRQQTAASAEERNQVAQDLRKEMADLEASLQKERTTRAASIAMSEEREERLQQELAAGASLLTTLQQQIDAKTENISSKDMHSLLSVFEGGERCEGLEEQILSLKREQKGNKHASEAPDRIHTSQSELTVVKEALQSETQKSSKLEQQLKRTTEELNLLKDARQDFSEQMATTEQLREVRDLLCEKQLELERTTSYAASMEVFHERQTQQLKDQIDHLTAQISRSDSVKVPICHPSSNVTHVGRSLKSAVSFFDHTAVRLFHIGRHSPIGRLVLFLYFLLIHVYLYVLSSRFQSVSIEQHRDNTFVQHTVIDQGDETRDDGGS